MKFIVNSEQLLKQQMNAYNVYDNDQENVTYRYLHYCPIN